MKALLTLTILGGITGGIAGGVAYPTAVTTTVGAPVQPEPAPVRPPAVPPDVLSQPVLQPAPGSVTVFMPGRAAMGMAAYAGAGYSGWACYDPVANFTLVFAQDPSSGIHTLYGTPGMNPPNSLAPGNYLFALAFPPIVKGPQLAGREPFVGYGSAYAPGYVIVSSP